MVHHSACVAFFQAFQSSMSLCLLRSWCCWVLTIFASSSLSKRAEYFFRSFLISLIFSGLSSDFGLGLQEKLFKISMG